MPPPTTAIRRRQNSSAPPETLPGIGHKRTHQLRSMCLHLFCSKNQRASSTIEISSDTLILKPREKKLSHKSKPPPIEELQIVQRRDPENRTKPLIPNQNLCLHPNGLESHVKNLQPLRKGRSWKQSRPPSPEYKMMPPESKPAILCNSLQSMPER